MQISAISGISGIAGISETALRPTAGTAAAPGQGFGKLVDEMVGKVSELQGQADQSIQKLATGQEKGLHEVMIAVEKASVSFQMLTQVRNKAVEAYQEIMRMPV